MNTVKQEMPPPGGFPSIVYERVPLKAYLGAPWKWMILGACIVIGSFGYYMDKKRWKYSMIEKRSATISILPLLVAESDRAKLKECRRLRDEEAEIMKDVEGWEVGKYYGQPVFKSLDPNEWYNPNSLEFWAQSKMSSRDHPLQARRSH